MTDAKSRVTLNDMVQTEFTHWWLMAPPVDSLIRERLSSATLACFYRTVFGCWRRRPSRPKIWAHPLLQSVLHTAAQIAARGRCCSQSQLSPGWMRFKGLWNKPCHSVLIILFYKSEEKPTEQNLKTSQFNLGEIITSSKNVRIV